MYLLRIIVCVNTKEKTAQLALNDPSEKLAALV